MVARKIVALIAGIGAVGVGYAGIAGQDHTTRDERTGEIVAGGELGALRIRIGDCFAATADGDIQVVDAIPCSEPHAEEVYAAFNMPDDGDSPYPGDSAVDARAYEGCGERFEEFVGERYESSVFDFGIIRPTEGSWNGIDDREVLCTLVRVDGSMTVGSAHGSRR